MNVGNSVRKSIDDWESSEHESAILHACNAIDGTAKKVYQKDLGVKARFTKLLRDNYSILGPMGIPGINLMETRFPVTVGPKASDGAPDIADVIYGIHRCSHGHGDELPEGFELIHNAAGPSRRTRMEVVKGAVRLSDRVIFGLIAVAVLSPANKGQSVPDGYYLTFGDEAKLVINDWWGRASDFPAVVARDPIPLVKLDFGDWMP